jgi:hypothetical protein
MTFQGWNFFKGKQNWRYENTLHNNALDVQTPYRSSVASASRWWQV